MFTDPADQRIVELERSADEIAGYRYGFGHGLCDSCTTAPGCGCDSYGPSCDECALEIVERHGGHYVGFFTHDNPGRVAQGCDGHAFAIVDERYLVDPWAKDAMGERAVYDLTKNEDVVMVRELYGDATCWHVGDDTERRAGDVSVVVRYLISLTPRPPR